MNSSDHIISTDIANGLDVIGDRWSLLILRDAFLGRSRFEEFRRYIGISKATLSRRLDTLIAEGILSTRPYGESKKRVEYKLTKKGAQLFPASLLSWQWEIDWANAKQERESYSQPFQLQHHSCQQPLNSIAVCRHCQQAIKLSEVLIPESASSSSAQLSEIKSLNRQRRVRATTAMNAEDNSLLSISDLIGDRWTLLILIAIFFGVKRYDGFQKQLNIASNILSARLSLLQQTSIIVKRTYQENPPRKEYQLTEKGESLFPIIMVLRQWVVNSMNSETDRRNVIHQPCGHPLDIEIQCKACNDVPTLSDVGFLATTSQQEVKKN